MRLLKAPTIRGRRFKSCNHYNYQNKAALQSHPALKSTVRETHCHCPSYTSFSKNPLSASRDFSKALFSATTYSDIEKSSQQLSTCTPFPHHSPLISLKRFTTVSVVSFSSTLTSSIAGLILLSKTLSLLLALSMSCTAVFRPSLSEKSWYS